MKKAIRIFFPIVVIALFYWFTVQNEPIKNLNIPYGQSKHVGKTPSYMERIKYRGKPLTHVAIGDSVVVGWGSSDNETSYIDQLDLLLEKEIGKDVITINRGVNAITSEELLEKLERKKVIRDIRKADIISINIGGNDILESAMVEGEDETIQQFDKIKRKYEKNLEQILLKVKEENPDALLVINELYNGLELGTKETFVTNIMLIRWNGVLYEKTKTIYPKLILPLSKELGPDEDIWYEDRVHPNDRGYEKMAKIWIREMNHTYKK